MVPIGQAVSDVADPPTVRPGPAAPTDALVRRAPLGPRCSAPDPEAAPPGRWRRHRPWRGPPRPGRAAALGGARRHRRGDPPDHPGVRAGLQRRRQPRRRRRAMQRERRRPRRLGSTAQFPLLLLDWCHRRTSERNLRAGARASSPSSGIAKTKAPESLPTLPLSARSGSELNPSDKMKCRGSRWSRCRSRRAPTK